MKMLVAYSIDAKRCAKKIVIEKFNEIICGNFAVPPQNVMEEYIRDFIDYSFNEYQARSKAIAMHPNWTEKQITDEVERLKMRYDNEYRENLRQAASEAVAEIENLLGSLNIAIKRWKIKNLE